MKTQNRIKRLIAIILVVISLLQWIPTDMLIAVADDTATKTDYIPGDVNGDGLVNALDVNLVRRHIVGGYDVKINALAADVDANGAVDSKDVNCLRRYIAGGYGVELKRGLERFTVKFETGEGTKIEDQVALEGTLISSFSKPYWEEHIFAGWCYDAALAQPVASNDTVTKNMTFYANWLEQLPLETLNSPSFVGKEDVGTDFIIEVVSSDFSMTSDDVAAAIEADDLTEPENNDVVTVSGENGLFTISGKNGFREGGSYRIVLNDDRLSFKGEDASARQYNFTVYRDYVMNLTTKDGIKYLSVNKISNIKNNGENVSTLDISFYETDGENVSVTELSTGSFEYEGNDEFDIGDIVCIYEGEIPTNRTQNTPKDKMGDMAYVEITEINGNKYSYISAEADDVIFTPDVLPMPESADTDNDADTITVENKYLDYSADIYSYNNLDSQTTVDKGDFLAFYRGEYGDTEAVLTGYGKITAVNNNENETTTITFISVTWEDVKSCMDVHSEDELSGDELLEGVDLDEMEEEIEQQAIDSGFADEAAWYLTSLSLATDNFKSLSSNMNLAGYKVELKDGSLVSPSKISELTGGSVKVEIEKTDIKAKISKKPTHLGDIAGTNADKKGLAISLDVVVVFTIASSNSDGHLEITITGSFVEEVGVDFSADVDAEWDWAVIIPYISDIKATANIDVMNYTAISFNATMITKENDEDDDSKIGEAIDIANEIKDLLDSMTDGEEQGDDVQDKLIDRYSEMVRAESDWIRIVEKNISEVKKGLPLEIPLINISFSVDFVVQLDASISVGFDFEYIEGKRHVFTVKLKGQKITSDTIDLIEKSYEFCFYAMGRIGLKVGIEMEFSIYPITKKLGSVGFSAGAGAYTKLYGYFFYELKYSDSNGKSQRYSGALLVQVGVYLELALEAQALGGRYSATANILDKEWKIYEAGRRDNVLDFHMKQEEVPEIVMKQFVRQIELSDEFFNMDYLDLISGEGKSAVYNDWDDPEKDYDFRNGENFTIEMTNDKFSYDPKTNMLAVHPDEDDLKITGEMIITWRKQPMSFSSKAIQRRFLISWDNLRDGYLIVPYTNGGSYVPITIKNYEQEVQKPEDPQKLGYTFAGWYSDENFEKPYTYPEIMPATDTNIYAKWKARNDIPYTVEHYQENLRSGEYELVETQTFAGTTDTYVKPNVKNYAGFVSPEQAQLKVLADGSATLRYYYNLERHNITFDSGVIDGQDVTAERDVTYTLKYGADINAPHMAVKGYTFTGWTVDGQPVDAVDDIVGTSDITYTATWEKNNDTEYRIEYYVQQADGRYTLQHLIKEQTTTGKVFTEEYLRTLAIDGTMSAERKFTIENAISFENMTVKGIVCSEAAVEGNGKTVIKVNYGRKKHTLTFDPNYDGAEPIVKDVFYEADVIAPQNVTRTGYTFAGWEVAPVTTMPAESLTYKAVWTPNNYTVKFHGGNDDVTGATADKVFTYDLSQALGANGFSRPYYTFAGWATQPNGAVVYGNNESVLNLESKNGAVVNLYAVWTPIEYTITYEANGATHTNRTTYTTEQTFALTPASRIGYTFDGWYDNAEFTGKAITEIALGLGGNKTLYAKFNANTNTAYKVEHYQEQLDGSYVLADTDNLNGTTDSVITPSVKNYTGFISPAAQAVAVRADGSLVVDYRYRRNSYTITFDAVGGSVTPSCITEKYGTPITLPTPLKDGYGFKGWYNGTVAFNDATMGADNITLTALWEAGKIGFTVNHYQQNVDGNGYTLIKSESGTADMDSLITPEINTYAGFTSPESATTITIKSKESENVVNYYYDRNQYVLSWDIGGANAIEQDYTQGNVYYGAQVRAPELIKTGYSYTWNIDVVTTMPAKDLAYVAMWTPDVYKVSFDTNGGTVVSGNVSQRNVAYDSTYGELADVQKAGYTFLGWYNGDKKVDADTVMNNTTDHTLTAEFEIITYTIAYNGVMTDEHNNPATYTIEDVIALAAPTARVGYTFVGWYDNAEFNGDAIASINKGSVGDVVLYAKWIENVYPVIFHAVNGTTDQITRDILFTGILGENTFEYAGYEFIGWSDGVDNYTPDTSLTELVDINTEALHLSAVWQKQRYTITYNNVEATEHDNVGEYTVEDTVSLGAPNDRIGYIFGGWYTNESFEGEAVETITAGSVGSKIFYAKWDEITYTVVFDSNNGTGATDSSMILFSGNLPANTYTRVGYTFIGWSTQPDGEKEFDDNALISGPAAYANDFGRITLYAVWQLNEYTITYNLGSHAASSSHNNPTVYSIETGADIVLEDITPKTNFKFGGWYTDAKFTSEKVTSIAFTDTANYTLYAKWEHGGNFTVSQKSVSGYKVTYTVKRTVPSGAELLSDTQTVYVRTQNGTAYGTTSDSTGQDKYHFIHNYAVLSFGKGDSSKEFVVTEKDDYLSNYVTASYQIGGTSRKYYVEIYRIENTTGGLAGVISTARVTRTMPLSSYELTKNMYRWCSHTGSSSPTTVTHKGYDKNTARTYDPASVANSGATSAELAYRSIVSSRYGYRLSFDIREINDGYQHIKFSTIDPDGSKTRRGEYVFATKHKEKASDWGRNVSFPNIGSGSQGDIMFNVGDCSVYESYTTYDEDVKYAVISSGNKVYVEFDASGSGDDDWQYRYLKFEAKVHDKNKPSLQYAAPLATTSYKKGEWAYISVIYSEPINSISGTPSLSLSSKLSTYFESPTYVSSGTGTNALVFKVKAKKDISADDVQNKINLYLAYPVSGVGGSFSTNIGTVSATVKDILGN